MSTISSPTSFWRYSHIWFTMSFIRISCECEKHLSYVGSQEFQQFSTFLISLLPPCPSCLFVQDTPRSFEIHHQILTTLRYAVNLDDLSGFCDCGGDRARTGYCRDPVKPPSQAVQSPGIYALRTSGYLWLAADFYTKATNPLHHEHKGLII